MRERGFLAALRFYRGHFVAVFTVSLVFYLAIVVLAAIAIAELGLYAILPLLYLAIASIFWLQAPLARLVDDARNARPNRGVRRTFESLYPRLGSITGGSFLAAVGVFFASGFFLVPGLLLLARWALIIPVMVVEETGPIEAFGRSTALVRGHTGRVIGELLISGVLLYVIWTIAFDYLLDITSVWASIPLALVFLALATPPIPLMRTLSYYDLIEAEAASLRELVAVFRKPPHQTGRA
jgi:hypothetical protein